MMIRAATPDDLPAIAIIQGQSTWEPADYLKYNCMVAVIDNRVAGFLASRETTTGEREILNLVVDSGCRRQGIARALLQHELESFRGTWFLEVRESNTAAIGLYRTLGFQPAGRRQEYYLEPPEAAIVMRFFS
jgi:[ribosomal protein S18]-alanine N-acetyltransferase